MYVALAVIVVCAAVGVTIWRPALGVVGLVAFLPFNGLITALLVVANESLAALVIGGLKDAVLLTLLVITVVTRRVSLVRKDVLVLVIATITVGLLAGIGTPNLEMAAYGWRNDFEPLLLLIAIPAVLNSASSRSVGLSAAIAAQVAAVISIATWALDLNWLYFLGRLPVPDGETFPFSLFVSGSDRPRAFSPFSAPNEMALGVLVLLAIIWCIAGLSVRTRLLLSVLPLVAIGLTISRSGYLGVAALGIVLLYLWLRESRPRLAQGLGIGGVVVLVVVAAWLVISHLAAGSDSSIEGHADSVGEAVQILLRNPFGLGLGEVGPRAIRYLANPTYVESFWLLLALEAGPIALLLFVALLARTFQLSLFSRSRLAHTAVLAISASLVSQLVLPTLQDASVSYLLWIAVSIGLVGVREELEAKRAAAQPLEV